MGQDNHMFLLVYFTCRNCVTSCPTGEACRVKQRKQIVRTTVYAPSKSKEMLVKVVIINTTLVLFIHGQTQIILRSDVSVQV